MSENFLEYIKLRGYFNQCTNEDGLKKKLKETTTGYIGFDCTSDSLHIGSLLPLMLLKNFQKFGHKPIILLGGGTTLVGDPSGKDKTRQILSSENINNNKKKLAKIFKKFLNFDNSLSNCALIVDNYKWLEKLKYISFLRNIGSKFSVNKMLNLDSIKQRISREQNLSFLEFNYSILQAYDFFELYKKHNCLLQFGGSDQWGNIVSGIDLVKKESNEEVFGLTTHLLTTSTGSKMGKTAEGAIWLSEDKLSSLDFWQFWRNTTDADVIRFLNLFTEIPSTKLSEYMKFTGSDLNKLKIILANEITSYCHGKENAKKAALQASKVLTTEKEVDSEIIKSTERKIKIDKNTLDNGYSLKQALMDLKLTSSIGESKRLIMQGAIRINDKTINNKEFLINTGQFSIKKINNSNTNYLIINVGKKKYGLVELIT